MQEASKRISVIECIPLALGIPKETLSYFTSLDVPIGAVIRVPVRHRRIPALVSNIRSAVEVKTDIKKAGFALRKIEKIETLSFFSPLYIEAVRLCADYFATTKGAVLFSIFPSAILEQISKVKFQSSSTEAAHAGDRYVVQAETEERFAHYRSLVREEFAKHSSVFFCLPTIEDIKRVKNQLEKGIERYTFVIHGSLSKKEQVLLWNRILEEKHPVVIIGTGMFLSIPRQDIATIIIERESSRSYKSQKRPFIDFRVFADFLAKETKKNLILGDTLLRVETISEYKSGGYLELIPLKFRSLLGPELEIIDMKGKKPSRGDFSTLSPALSKLIERNKEQREHLFIFSARKGFASSIVCQDCGRLVLSVCSRPMILHKDERENFFFCPVCKEKRSAKEVCENCGSWRLMSLGVGIERVEEEIKEKFPKINLFRLDKDTASTYKKALEIVKKFQEAPSGVLLGTEMALLYLSSVENSAVASIDSLFSVPDFRINEKILYILLTIKGMTERKCIVQTRNPGQSVLDYAARGNLIDFYKMEIKERKALLYPPFSVIVKIRVAGQKAATEKVMGEIAESFKEYEPNIFPSLPRNAREKNAFALIIKVPKEKWVDERLLAKLRSLPPYVSVEVDPESLL